MVLKYLLHFTIFFFSISDWEARMDNYGRIFYIDHKNHTTTWKKPSIGSTPTLESTSNQILNTNDNQNGKIKHQQERQQLDRRYQCIRKSIARNASLFLQESPKNELPPTTITPEKQRELLIKVRFSFE